MNVLSLFDGISCGRIAMERAGVKVDKYTAYEIDENAKKISAFNYPDIIQKGDVFEADFTQYKNTDFLIGGSPCTYWSIAKAKNGRETTSSGLGWDLYSQYVRALKESQPQYFIYENNFSMTKDIKNAITETFGFEPVMINSNLLSAQTRRRLYWVGRKENGKYKKVFIPQPEDKKILLTDVVDFSKLDFRPVSKWTETYFMGRKKIDTLKDIHSEKSHTLTTSKYHAMNYYLNDDKTKYCNLSVKNWESLQTLPEGYVDNVELKSEESKYKAIGNGWTVDVIAYIITNCLHEKQPVQSDLF